MTYVAPSYASKSFTCPHCRVYARQWKWGYQLAGDNEHSFQESQIGAGRLKIAVCEHCSKYTLWFMETQVYPMIVDAPAPNPDMPDDVKDDYAEAASILATSPRGAAALLRLAVQKLMVALGQPGKNINDDIKALVAGGLSPMIQQALDLVRVTGNNAVHPGLIDVDDSTIAGQLFPLINLIVESQISHPSKVAAMYSALPQGTRDTIQKRDQKP